MFWSSPIAPQVGGPLMERLHCTKDEITADRAALAEERAAAPSVAEFYAGRNVFMTGGSGFMGRLVIEMLLRTCPDIGTVYLVLRTKRGVDPQDRLQGLLDVALFDRVRAERPGALDKIVVLPGDTTSLGLGLSAEHQSLLRREVSVVFHVAASVRFDDPFQKAVFTNVRSTREVVELARGMSQLRVLVHVSTAYTNINREPLEERVYTPNQDWRAVIRWAEELGDPSPNAIDFLGPKVLGFQPNTYSFTKALAEKVIDDVADELPVVITRPSIVVATFRDPVPGWIDNLYGFGGFWAGGFKGIMRITYGDKFMPFDTIPADVATKTTILASWQRGLKPFIRGADVGAEVVNVAVGHRAGVTFGDMEWIVSDEGIGRIVPFPGVVRPPKVRATNCWAWYTLQFWYHHLLYGLVLDLLARAVGAKPRVLAIYRKASVAIDATKKFQKEFNFVLEKQKVLLVKIHPKDVDAYCSVPVFSSRDTVENFRKLSVDSVRGILRYVLKEEDNPEKNWKAIVRLKWILTVYHFLMASLLFSAVFWLLKFVYTSRTAEHPIA